MIHQQADGATSSSSFILHPSSFKCVPSLICSLAVAAVAGGFAFYHVSAPMPWADELQTLGCSMASWREGLYLATHSQNMPVGYWLISKIVISLAGVSFVPMRVVSGVTFVAFAWLASRLLFRWLPRSIAIPAAFVIAVHPALVWHARDGRVYSILLLVETISVGLMLARPFRGRAILWTLTSAAMVYLHHHALFVLAIQAVILFDLRMDLRRWLPLVVLLVLPDLLFVYWGMQSPNVASQMFGAGQTFGPNVLLNLDRLGAGSPEYVYGPLPPVWRKVLGCAMVLVPTVMTAMRGGTALSRAPQKSGVGLQPSRAVPGPVNRHDDRPTQKVDRAEDGPALHGTNSVPNSWGTAMSWMGLAVLGLLIVPAAVHDAMDVFYEPRFVVLVIPLVVVWLLSSLAKLPSRLPAWIVSAGLVGLFVATDLDVIKPHVLPYRPCRADINDALERMPGKIVMHPGYLVGCWPVPPGFDRQGRVVLSDEGVMVGVERRVAGGNATLYSPDMPWSRFRREIVHGGPFTLIQGSPMLYPRKHEDFCRPDEPWQTGYRMERLWPDHPFVVIYRFEPPPASSASTTTRP